MTADEQPEMLGPYELRGELGRGAMARVWRAFDPRLEREVAIKEPFLDPNLNEDVREEMSKRFVKEARTAARLQHPNIVTVHAADVYDGRPAIVMELIEGATLGDLLEAGAFAPPVALDALDQLLDAVGYAHDHGVVHRDIKPDNIFVDRSGRIKLADFGIAHIEDATMKATAAGTVLGTPGYMSPEQARGLPVDARSDIFSIGIIGYEMLAGRHPFGAGNGDDSTTLLYRIVHEDPPSLPNISREQLPADMCPAIMAALAKDPVNRPQSAADFKSMLHGAAVPTHAAVPVTSALEDVVASKGETSALSKWMPYILVAIVCVAVLLVVYLVASGGSGLGPSSSTVISNETGNTSSDTSSGNTSSSSSSSSTSSSSSSEASSSTVTVSITGKDGDTRTQQIRRQGTTERVFPDSNTRALSKSEVAALSDAERCIAWNEIVAASNGYAFKNSGLASYFNSCSWYHRDPNADASGGLSNGSAAYQNVEFLKSYTSSWYFNLAAY